MTLTTDAAVEAPAVDPVDVNTGEPVEGVTPGASAPEQGAVTQPTPAPVQVAQPKPEPKAPARDNAELQWLRATVSQLAEQNRATQAKLREYEYAELDPEEAQKRMLEEQKKEFEAQRQAWENQTALQQWKEYFGQFEPPADALVGDDPVQWTDKVLTHQQQKIKDLLDTVAALKKAQETKEVPKVTAKQGGGVPGKTIWDLSLDEIENLAEQARFGRITGKDLPPIA